jgi:hypothetical protein
MHEGGVATGRQDTPRLTGPPVKSYWLTMASIVSRLVVAGAVAWSLAAPLRAEQSPVFDPAVVRRITPEEVQQRRDAGEKPIILDARASVGDVIARGAVHVPNERIETWAKDVPKGALIVAYCT